jgi:hypothetical protein
MVFFNTREDVYNSLEIDINATVATLKDILNDRFKWQVVKVLLTKEEGIEDETHLIIESENEILQSELQEDENSKLFQLGLTVEEAEEIIENPGLALAKYKGEVE